MKGKLIAWGIVGLVAFMLVWKLFDLVIGLIFKLVWPLILVAMFLLVICWIGRRLKKAAASQTKEAPDYPEDEEVEK